MGTKAKSNVADSKADNKAAVKLVAVNATSINGKYSDTAISLVFVAICALLRANLLSISSLTALTNLVGVRKHGAGDTPAPTKDAGRLCRVYVTHGVAYLDNGKYPAFKGAYTKICAHHYPDIVKDMLGYMVANKVISKVDIAGLRDAAKKATNVNDARKALYKAIAA